MEGIPLALDAERSPMLELLVIRNLECIFINMSTWTEWGAGVFVKIPQLSTRRVKKKKGGGAVKKW